MKYTITWAIIFSGLCFTGAPAGAQDFWYIPHVDEAKTPIEVQLQGPELAMPGFGIASTKAAIIKRLEYALDNKWLSASQDQQLCNDLKVISDREQSYRDADGKLSFKARNELARQLTELNNKFEELVLVREQSSPGVQGLLARQALMIERVNQAVAEGRINGRRGYQIKSEIKSVATQVPEKDISDEQAKKIAFELTRINNDIDHESMRVPAVAGRQTPFTR
jgi:hypothetical protein